MITKQLASRLFVPGDAVFFDELNKVDWRVTTQRGNTKAWVSGKKIFRLAMQIREVAAATTRHKNFLADLVRALKNEYASSAVARNDGAHQPCSAATNDYDVVSIHSR